MTDYVSPRLANPQQVAARSVLRGRRAFALLMAPRTRKTKVVVDDWGEMVASGAAEDLLVVAPKGAYAPWPDQIRLDLASDIAHRACFHLWESGKAKTRTHQLSIDRLLQHAGPRVLVVNIEALSQVEAAQNLCIQFLSRRPGRSVMVVDESVEVKNHESVCGGFVVDRLAPLAGWRRILTGLVAPRGPLDLYNQFRFLDPAILGGTSFTAFRARYAKVRDVCMIPEPKLRGILRSRLGTGNRLTRPEMMIRVLAINPELDPRTMADDEMHEYLEAMADALPRDQVPAVVKRLGGYVQTVPIIDGYQNVDELREKIAPYSFRVRLEDCYDMPPSSYGFLEVPWHPEQKRVYEDLRKNATAELETLEHVTANHVVTRMMRLHQVLCGHTVTEDGDERDVPEYRTARILDEIDGYAGKAVVWCAYRRCVEKMSTALRKRYGDDSVSCFWGGNAATREAEEVLFKEGPARFMVATPDAGGYARDWSVADLVLYHSQRNNLDHRQQSEDRAKAYMKMRGIRYGDARIAGTVEDRIIAALRDKIDLAAEINGDEWREWLV